MKTWNVRDAVVFRTGPYESRMGRVTGVVNRDLVIVLGWNSTEYIVHTSRLVDAVDRDLDWIDNNIFFTEPSFNNVADPLPAAT